MRRIVAILAGLCFTSILGSGYAEEAAKIAAEFDGVDDYLRLPSLNQPTQALGLQFWFKPLQKATNGHLESCLVSQGSWNSRFKVSLLPWNQLRLTFRSASGAVMDCDVDEPPLQFGRWFHLAASLSTKTSEKLVVWVNGVKHTSTCGTKARNFKLLASSSLPVTIGSCYDAVADDLFKGQIVGVEFYNKPLTDETVVNHMLGGSEADDPAPIARYPLIAEDVKDHAMKLLSQGIRSHGNPRMKSYNSGDGYLSVLLTIAEQKSDRGGSHNVGTSDDQAPSLIPELFLLTPDEPAANEGIVQSLRRRFAIDRDESDTWATLNQYAVRLESLGHLYAESVRQRHAPSSPQQQSKPTIALIVPATSKGIQLQNIQDLPLVRGLLPSLFETADPKFQYKVYLAVNQQDELFNDAALVASMWEAATRQLDSQKQLSIDYEVVPVPDTILPSRALSALFNVPTLVAHAQGCDYFYLLNDDVVLSTPGWADAFVSALRSNPLMPNLGVAGGVDVSDTITPHIEFPFFHRTHVDIFDWCGGNPWVFRNWWEDNWLTDVYIPFDSVFYLKHITVTNYGGLARPSSGTGSMDPRYQVQQGRRLPHYYVAEVDAGRQRIQAYLRRAMHNAAEIEHRGLGYCASNGSVASMPIGPHEDAIDPCAPVSYSKPKAIPKKFALPVHAQELPHVPYASVLADFPNNNSEEECSASTRPTATRYEQARRALKRHFGTIASMLPVRAGSFCSPDAGFRSCGKSRHVFVLHHHVTLYDRYGSDKRLFHLLETLVALGHRVTLGGMHISALEAPSDRKRLEKLGVDVVDPLADGAQPLTPKLRDALLRGRHGVPDLVILPLWFWSAVPVPEVFLPTIRQLVPKSTRVAVLSDDVHYWRQQSLAKMIGAELSETETEKLERLREREYAVYAAADRIITITNHDKENLLRGAPDDHDHDHDHDRVRGAGVARHNLSKKTVRVRYSIGVREIVAPEAIPLFSQREGLVMVGNGENPTNKASMEWFLRDVLPYIRKHPGSVVPVTIVGADWTATRNAFSSVPGVRFTGLLPSAELTEVLHRSRVFISPITVSTGLNTKNVLALSHGIPLVTTPTGAVGLCDGDGSSEEGSSSASTECELALQHALSPDAFIESLSDAQMNKVEVGDKKLLHDNEAAPDRRASKTSTGGKPAYPAFMVASSAEQFAEHVMALYNNPDLWQGVSQTAVRFCRSTFSLEAQARDVDALLLNTSPRL